FSDYYVASYATHLPILSRYPILYFTPYFTLYFTRYPRLCFTPNPIPYCLHHVETELYNPLPEALNKDCARLTERNRKTQSLTLSPLPFEIYFPAIEISLSTLDPATLSTCEY